MPAAPLKFAYGVPDVSAMAGYGAEYQHGSTSYSLALLLATERLKVIAADHLANGRFAVNVVSRWFKGEFTALGEPWLEHDELPSARTRRSSRGGSSTAARASAAASGRTAPKFGLNGFLIARDTEAEARETLGEIVAHADRQAVEGFGAAVRQAGPSTADGKGMWQDSTFEDLVQYYDGFRTGLLGFFHYDAEAESFGKRVLPLVREPEERLPEAVPASVPAHA